jgi:cerevisin
MPIRFISFFVLSLFAFLTATSLASKLGSPMEGCDASPRRLAPLYKSGKGSKDARIKNSYIIMFKDGVSKETFDNHINFVHSVHAESELAGRGGIRYKYDDPPTGYSGKFSKDVLDKIRARPEVDFVEENQIVRMMNSGNDSEDGTEGIDVDDEGEDS